MYAWRKMTREERLETMHRRMTSQRPWHGPPHFRSDTTDRYLFTAACLNHWPIAGHTRDRLAEFERALLDTADRVSTQVHAWVVMPDHYHFLAQTADCLATLKELGKLHGRSSFQWNGEENLRGRQIWCNAAETAMKSDRHFWATMNYIHHNPVKHGYVTRWQDWPFTSAHQYLAAVGDEEARKVWNEFPVSDYGKGWDD
jgi:putative transposase